MSSVNASVAADQNAVATGSLGTDAPATSSSSSLTAASADASQINPYTAQPDSSPYTPGDGSDPYSPAGSSSAADPYTGGQSVDAAPADTDQVSSPLTYTPADADQGSGPLDYSPADPGQVSSLLDYSPADPGQVSSLLDYSPADPGQVSSLLDYSPADPGQVSSPLNYTPADPLNYTLADGADTADAIDGQGSDDQSAAGSATPSPGPRSPDYVTLEVSGGNWVTIGVSLTFASDGNVFIGPELGVGLPGISGTLEGGWIGQGTVPTPAQIDNFVSGWSVTLGGFAPTFGDVFGPGVAEVWGNPGSFDSSSFGTQVGVGLGAGMNLGLLGSYSWQVGTWR